MKPIIACLLLGLCASPASADEYAFAKDGFLLQFDRGTDEYLSLTPTPELMFGPISAGDLEVHLFADPMAKVRGAFGGEIRSHDDRGYHTDWLCYTDGPTRTWFLSTTRGDTLEQGLVDWIIAEPSNAAYDAGYGCVENQDAKLAPQDFPTLGATRDELSRHFGMAIPATEDNLGFFLQEDTAGDDGYSLVRTAYFRLKDDTVQSLSFSQWDSR